MCVKGSWVELETLAAVVEVERREVVRIISFVEFLAGGIKRPKIGVWRGTRTRFNNFYMEGLILSTVPKSFHLH